MVVLLPWFRYPAAPVDAWSSEWEASLEEQDFDFKTPGLVFLRLAKARLSDSAMMPLNVAATHDEPCDDSAQARSIGFKPRSVRARRTR